MADDICKIISKLDKETLIKIRHILDDRLNELKITEQISQIKEKVSSIEYHICKYKYNISGIKRMTLKYYVEVAAFDIMDFSDASIVDGYSHQDEWFEKLNRDDYEYVSDGEHVNVPANWECESSATGDPVRGKIAIDVYIYYPENQTLPERCFEILTNGGEILKFQQNEIPKFDEYFVLPTADDK